MTKTATQNPWHVVLVPLLGMMLSAQPALARDRALDVADFKSYVEVCKANPDERGLDGCIADQVDSKASYLGDILAETANGLSDADQKLLTKSQEAFEAYLKSVCHYQLEALPSKPTKQQELLCALRLANQRIEDVLEGSDFLSLE